MEISLTDRNPTDISYGAVYDFWPVQLVELAEGPTGCGEVAMDGCSLAWNFGVTRSAILTEV
jgi:hypothetical protein